MGILLLMKLITILIITLTLICFISTKAKQAENRVCAVLIQVPAVLLLKVVHAALVHKQTLLLLNLTFCGGMLLGSLFKLFHEHRDNFLAAAAGLCESFRGTLCLSLHSFVLLLHLG